MRPLPVALTIIVVSALSYTLAPSVITYLFDSKSAQAESAPAVAATPRATSEAAAPAPDAGRQSGPVLQVPEPAAKRPSSRRGPARRAHERHRVIKKEPQQETGAATGLQTEAPAPAPMPTQTAESAAQAVPSRGQLSPLQDRWIGALSGQRAQLTMGRSEPDASCADGACERIAAPRDVSLVGVVFDSERVMKSPSSALDGRVVRGGYRHNTPAVYLK